MQGEQHEIEGMEVQLFGMNIQEPADDLYDLEIGGARRITDLVRRGLDDADDISSANLSVEAALPAIIEQCGAAPTSITGEGRPGGAHEYAGEQDQGGEQDLSRIRDRSPGWE